MYKSIIATILALMMIFGLIGCSAAPSSPAAPAQDNSTSTSTAEKPKTEQPAAEKHSTVSFNSWSVADEGWRPTYDQMKAKFEESKGGSVTLELEGQAYADTFQSLLTRAAAQDGPDIAMVQIDWLPQLNALGCLADLSDYISQEAKDDCNPGVIDSFTVDGKLIAFPFFIQPICLFYNKDLLAAAGIAEPPKTRAELLEDCEKIAALGTDANGNKIYGIGIQNSNTEYQEGTKFLPMLWMNGGDVTDASGKVVLNSQENIQTYKDLQHMYLDGISPNGLTNRELRNAFGAGYLGFYIDMQSQVGTFCAASQYGDDFINHMGACNVPEDAGYNESIVFVVLNTCEDMEAAGAAVEFLSGIDGLQTMYDNGKTKFSSRKSVMSTVFADVSDEITKAFIKSSSVSRELPCVEHTAFAQAMQEVLDAMVAVASGGEVEATVEKKKKNVTELYANEK